MAVATCEHRVRRHTDEGKVFCLVCGVDITRWYALYTRRKT